MLCLSLQRMDPKRNERLYDVKVLVVGHDGTSHAVAWLLRRSPGVRDVYCAPGNAGSAGFASTVTIPVAQADDLAAWAQQAAIDLAVVLDEAALAAGVADALRAVGVPRVVGAGAYLFTATNTAGAIHSLDDGETSGCTLLALTDGASVLILGAAATSLRLRGDGRSDDPITAGMGAVSPPPGIGVDELAMAGSSLESSARELREQDDRPYRGPLSAVYDARTGTVRACRATWQTVATLAILPRLRSDLLLHLADALDGRLRPSEMTTPLLLDEKAAHAVAVTLVADGYPDPAAYETGYGLMGLGRAPSGGAIFHEATRSPYAARTQTVVIAPDEPARRSGGLLGLFSFGTARRSQAEQRGAAATRDPYSAVVTAGGRVVTVVGTGPTRATARALAYQTAEGVSFTGRTMRTDIGGDAQ